VTGTSSGKPGTETECRHGNRVQTRKQSASTETECQHGNRVQARKQSADTDTECLHGNRVPSRKQSARFLCWVFRAGFLFESRVMVFYCKLIVGIPRTGGLLYSSWQPLGITSSVTPIGQLHQSPPLPIPGDLGRGPSHQCHVLKHRDTYGQAQVCS